MLAGRLWWFVLVPGLHGLADPGREVTSRLVVSMKRSDDQDEKQDGQGHRHEDPEVLKPQRYLAISGTNPALCILSADVGILEGADEPRRRLSHSSHRGLVHYVRPGRRLWVAPSQGPTRQRCSRISHAGKACCLSQSSHRYLHLENSSVSPCHGARTPLVIHPGAAGEDHIRYEWSKTRERERETREGLSTY